MTGTPTKTTQAGVDRKDGSRPGDPGSADLPAVTVTEPKAIR